MVTSGRESGGREGVLRGMKERGLEEAIEGLDLRRCLGLSG